MGAFDFVKIFRVNKSISIDLGTANILIYDKQRKKIVLNEPSVVARDRKTGKLIAVGREAREMLGKTPDSIQAIKPLQDGVIADIDSTKEMITYFTISSSNLFPAILIDLLAIISSRERIAMSVEPPPISITILPSGCEIFTPEPIIAALPSSIIYVFLAPFTASNNAFLSTLVTSIGTQIITSGLNNEFP